MLGNPVFFLPHHYYYLEEDDNEVGNRKMDQEKSHPGLALACQPLPEKGRLPNFFCFVTRGDQVETLDNSVNLKCQ